MDNFTLFTNNSIVAEFFTNKEMPIEVKWIAAPTMEVLIAAKNAAKQGAVILSNPLQGVRTSQPIFSPSAKPPPPGRQASNISSINPYLTVLTSPPGDTVDFGSVKRIDEALSLYKKNARLRFLSHNDEAIKTFQAVDLEITLATIAHFANANK